MDLTILQEQHARWLGRNFPDQEPWQALLGVTEELGEISHAYLKHVQGIRGVDHVKLMGDITDGVGDLVIFLSGFCTNMGIDFGAVVQSTWDQVSERDWVKRPTTG
jgi:NTP pyrophosphatase (non-canonical NTP hydrolase)